MKKLNTALMALLVAGGLTACGSTSDTDPVETPSVEDVETQDETKGIYSLGDSFKFDGTGGLMELEIGETIQWHTIENEFSDHNGASVFSVPVSVTNLSGETSGLNMFDFTLFGSEGTTLDSVGSLLENDISFAGEVRDGATKEGYFFFLYDGDGEYVVEFGSWTSTDVEVVFDITK